MLGFERFPATAARTDLTFWLVDVVDEPVVVPAGTQVSTAGDIGRPTRLHDAQRPRHHPARADGVASSRPVPTPTSTCGTRSRLPNQAVVCFPRTPTTPGDRFYLGFERTLAGNAIRMTISANIEGIGVIPTKPPLRWEVWQGSGWIPTARCTATPPAGSTATARSRCSSRLPTNRSRSAASGRTGSAPAVLEPEPGQPTYRASPQIRQIRVDSRRRIGDRRAQRLRAARGPRDEHAESPTRSSTCATRRCCRAWPARRSR